LISHDRTVETAEILEGGIGFNYLNFKVVGNRNFLDCSFYLFQNGTYTTALPTTTSSSTSKPNEEIVMEWGEVNDDTKLAEYDS
jgi:hypothetical protein